jgi:hypothetical protein
VCADRSADGVEHYTGTTNQISGSVVGPVVQASVIHGGVHVHVTQPPRAAPQQLPRPPRYFVNRKQELDALARFRPASAGSQTAVVSVIDGIAGVGKTALAVYWAHTVRDRFPDGRLYVDLRGFDPVNPPLPPADALQLLLEGLGVPPEQGAGQRRRPCGALSQPPQ